MERRQFVTLMGAAALGAPMVSRAQGKVVRMITGFPPGGSVDAVGRVLADRLKTASGDTIIVEPRPGAGARLAVDYVKDSRPDGLTMLFTPASMMTLYPSTFNKLHYDPSADFVPVGTVVDVQSCFMVAPNVPANTFAEYVAWVKADESARSLFGIPAEGSIPHFTAMSVAKAAGLPFNPVAYKGTAPMVNDILGGHVPTGLNPIADVADHHKAGKLKVLGVGGQQRSPLLPQVPTFAEMGYQVVGGLEWYGLFFPRNTPDSIVSAYARMVREFTEAPDIKEQFAPRGWQTHARSPAELASVIKSEGSMWRKVALEAKYVPAD